MRLCSYKMRVDTGFAPNPFGRSLTLATCKPDIRKTAREGDWIAGFTSKDLSGHEVESERLVYLMQVTEKMLLRDYFRDSRFQDKIPDSSARGPQVKAGDNIYRPLRSDAQYPEDFEQLTNANHFAWDHAKDINGEFVLVAGEFYYFGGGARELPGEVRPDVPRGQARYGKNTCSTRAGLFLEHMRSTYRPGRQGAPHNLLTSMASTRCTNPRTSTRCVDPRRRCGSAC